MNRPRRSNDTNTRRDSRPSLPLRGRNESPSPRPAKRQILASHLVIHGYGHWLSNDPSGSGSETIRKEELKEMGEIDHERKRVQHPRSEHIAN